MSELKLLINGNMVDGDSEMDVINPATGQNYISVPRASEAQANAAIAAAKAAFPAWSQTTLDERRACLNKFADLLEANGEELSRSLTEEQGKPIADAMGEVYGAAAFTRYFASLDIPTEVMRDDETRRIEIRHNPLGVVAAIIPWNFPVILMFFKLPAALMAGNTIVVKPAPTTPVTSLRIFELIKDVFPAGVVNIVTDQNDLGPVLTKHPDVAKVSFTGSTGTGAKVMASAAETVKRITLELGGNDPSIILDDVDVKETAPKVFDAAFANSGQVCLALKRAYVHENIYDEMVDELARLAKEAVVDDGFKQGTKMGPVQNKMQYDKVLGLIESAKKDGRVAAGGNAMDRDGYFIEPTIIADVADDAAIVAEEQFGPVLPVLKFSDADDAVARANNSEYGLGASVWSSDPAKAAEVARKIIAGTVWVNQHLELDPTVPFSGAKQSGLGTELGPEGLMEFTQRHVLNIAKA